MNKKELTASLARSTGLSRSRADKVVDAVFDILSTELEAGRKVVLPGFGTFAQTKRPARKGTNPSNGKPIQIGPKTSATFKAGKVLRERVAPGPKLQF